MDTETAEVIIVRPGVCVSPFLYSFKVLNILFLLNPHLPQCAAIFIYLLFLSFVLSNLVLAFSLVGNVPTFMKYENGGRGEIPCVHSFCWITASPDLGSAPECGYRLVSGGIPLRSLRYSVVRRK